MVRMSNNEVVRNVQMKREGVQMAFADDVKRPLIECLLIEMEGNEYLRNFFGALKGHAQTVRKASGADYDREVRKIHEQVQKFAAKKAEIVESLKARGITVNENVLGPTYTIAGTLGGKDYARYEYDYAYSFSGVEVKKEMLLNPNDSTFKDRYETAKAKIPEREERIQELKKKLRRQRIFGRFLAPNGDEYKKQISGLKVDIETERLEIGVVDRYKKEYDFFRNLTPGDRQLILQYFETRDAIRKGADAINEHQKEAEAKKPAIYDAKVIDQALERMQANGMSEDDIRTIFETLDDVTQKRRLGFYDKAIRKNPSGYEVETAFLRDIYGFDEETERVIINARQDRYFAFE